MARRTPATTPEQRENQLIAKAVDLAEQQMEDGTASAQVITHFLKLGSSREKLEQAMMGQRVALMKQQEENLKTAGRIEALIQEAVTAFKSYAIGSSVPDEYASYDGPPEL